MLKRLVKNSLIKTGLFPAARALKRSFSGETRRIFRDEQRLYRPFVRPGDLVFDVGVNVGQKSEIFLAIGARVVGVEPNPMCWPVIDYQFGKNPNYTLVRKAAGDAVGEATLHFVGTDATASLREDWPYVSVDGSAVETAATPVTTLDELIATYGVPALCKIDVEGFEKHVMAGLGKPVPLVTFEYHLSEIAELRACLDQLASLGPIELNANVMDTGDLVFESWLSPEAFLAHPELPHEADCWVRPAQA